MEQVKKRRSKGRMERKKKKEQERQRQKERRRRQTLRLVCSCNQSRWWIKNGLTDNHLQIFLLSLFR